LTLEVTALIADAGLHAPPVDDGKMSVNECATVAVQTRVITAKEKKPPKPLKVNSVPGLDMVKKKS